MNLATTLQRRPRLLVPLQAAWRDWANDDAPILAYLLKVWLASMLAMWLSLRFELEQPRTAMLTVAIVMQSRSGMVFAKSYYRLIGTLVGVAVSVLLVALFAQERVLFLVCMALWIGLCTAGSMIYRNHQSYAFVLAGYTLCIVGLPAAQAPELTFDIATTRISEILAGLFAAMVVSDVIFPQRLWSVMVVAVRRRFRDFSDLLRAHAHAPEDARTSRAALMRFIGDVFSLESFRASSALENDESRRHRQQLSRMNNEFMEVSTTFHAFEQLLRRQREDGHPAVWQALLTLYRPLAAALSVDERSARTEQEAHVIAGQLKTYRNSFDWKLAIARRQLPEALDATERLDLETGVEMLQRLAEELHAYAATYAALGSAAATTSAEASVSPRLEKHYDPLAVTLAGVRGAAMLGLMASLWILTDWRSGIEGITLGVISSTLFATSPTPTRTIAHFMTGAIIGTALAYVCNFHWLTQAQGFEMLALAVSPAILLAAWLTTRPAISVVGAGIFIVFLLHIGFNNLYSASPVTFFNDALADLLAVLVAGTLYALIDISGSGWSRRRISAALRQLVVAACREPLALRRVQLEMAARDLVQRAGSAQRLGEPEDRIVIDWLLATLEIGHAVIALREHMPVAQPAVQQALTNSLEAIAELHTSPSIAQRKAASDAIESAIEQLNSESGLALAASSRRSLLTMLHFIRSALQDENSVLALKETAHAA
jgi:uncharacterized membrane protein YccC